MSSGLDSWPVEANDSAIRRCNPVDDPDQGHLARPVRPKTIQRLFLEELGYLVQRQIARRTVLPISVSKF